MPPQLLKNAALVLSDRIETAGSVLIENGRIAAVGTAMGDARRANEIDLSGGLLFPGFIDVHNHGAVGHDVNASTAEDLLEVAAFLAKNGVTAWLPTLVPDSDENYRCII